tara:strand:- start:43835 stop:44632 length:798 start_codon:yes stop_codon:yes gene_type:complete
MEKKKSEFEEFKKIALRPKESIISMFTITPLSIRVAYFIKKKKLNISPDQITLSGLFFFSPLTILLLFLAPLLNLRILYLFAAISFYLVLFVDWMDGQVARGLNKSSDKGAFLDLIADRVAIIIFFVVIFSIGLWTNNAYLLIGSTFLFVLKTFHLMVITKLYYAKERNKEAKEVAPAFSGLPALNKMGILKINSIFIKINNILKIKRWEPAINPPEQYSLTIMLPVLLVFFNLEIFATFLLYFYLFAFSFFFLYRIKNLLKGFI